VNRSLPQNRHYHAIIGEIARAKRVDRELAKRILIVQFRAETERDPQFAVLWPADSRTRHFPKALASAFTDWLYAWKVEHVVKRPSQTHA
jgi:hypothetical protein